MHKTFFSSRVYQSKLCDQGTALSSKVLFCTSAASQVGSGITLTCDSLSVLFFWKRKTESQTTKKCAVFTESSWSPMLLSSTSYTKYCCFPFLYVSGEMFCTQKSQQLKNLSEIHMVTWFAFHRSSLFAGAMIFCCFWKNNLCSSWEIHASSSCSYIFLK